MPRVSPLRGHEDEIVRRYEAGESTLTIAVDFGVTDAPVRRVLHERGVTRRPRGPYRRPLAGSEEVVAVLYRDGLSLRDIATLMACSVIAVKGALVRRRVPLRPPGSHATRKMIEARREMLAGLGEVNDLDARRVVAELRRRRPEGGKTKSPLPHRRD
jgi:hypothetical protein